MAEAPVFTPTPAGVSAAPAAALKKVKIVVTATARAAAEARKNVNVNEPDPDDPTKPRKGTLKGVQAAENVYRRQIQQMYSLNPNVWFLRLLVQARTEELLYWDATKKLLYHEYSAPVYGSFTHYEEAEAWVELQFSEFIEGRERIQIWDEYVGEARFKHRIFSDRMSVFLSELSLRNHITSRGLQLQDELLRNARETLGRNTIEDSTYALFRREHSEFLGRLEVVLEEFTIRSQSMLEQETQLHTFVRHCADQRKIFEEETVQREDIYRSHFVPWFEQELEPLYEQAVVLDEECRARRRIDAEVDSFLDMAFDALHRLLDLFYQDRVEQRRKAEEAEALRREAEAAALAQLLQLHVEQRADLEKQERVGRSNETPPILERRRVTERQDEAVEGNEDDEDKIEYRLVEVGPPLGIEVVEVRERDHLYELFEQERWAIELQLASDAQQQERLMEQAAQRRIRVEQEEATARDKLYETLRLMDEAFAVSWDAFLVASKELCALEEDQRATLEWAEVESRLVVSKLAPKRGVAPALPAVAKPAAAPAVVEEKRTEQPPIVAPAPAPVVPQYVVPPAQVMATLPPPQDAPPQVMALPPGYAMMPAAPTPMPYRQPPHWELGHRVIYVQGPPVGPHTSGHPIPTVGPPLPYDSKLFRRTGPDGGQVTADLKAAEDEVESMVTAATLPLGILEYELRARWARTKQQLVDAIQQKLIEPLHQLAAELPDGDDIARRARQAVPPHAEALQVTPPPSLGWSPNKKDKRRLAPFLTPPPRPKQQQVALPVVSRSPLRTKNPLQTVPDADEALQRIKLAQAREEAMREQVLRSMRGMLSTKLTPLPKSTHVGSDSGHQEVNSEVLQPWNAKTPTKRR